METSPLPTPQVAAILTLPFDVVKTQRQVALGAVEAVRGEGPRLVRGRAGGVPAGSYRASPWFAVTPPHADSTWLLLRRIRAESGTRGLFAGERLCVCPRPGGGGAPWDLTSDPSLPLPPQASSQGSSRPPRPAPS